MTPAGLTKSPSRRYRLAVRAAAVDRHHAAAQIDRADDVDVNEPPIVSLRLVPTFRVSFEPIDWLRLPETLMSSLPPTVALRLPLTLTLSLAPTVVVRLPPIMMLWFASTFSERLPWIVTPCRRRPSRFGRRGS